jgi:hypothetical protein
MEKEGERTRWELVRFARKKKILFFFFFFFSGRTKSVPKHRCHSFLIKNGILEENSQTQSIDHRLQFFALQCKELDDLSIYYLINPKN